MARNTTAMKRGWNYDYANSRLCAMVDGVEAFHIDAASATKGTLTGFQMGVPTYSSAGTIDGAGVSLANGYSASASNRFSAFEVVADTGSTDLTGDTYEAAIHGKLNIGTTQTNASLMAGLFSLDVGASVNLAANYYALRGHLDFWGSSTISGTSHVGAISAYVEHEGTTTISASQYCDGVDIYQVGSPTATGYNSAINIRASATASNWKHAIYGAADNGINLTCVNDGIRVTSSTLSATAGRVGYFDGTIAAANLGDGYGAVEVNITLTGTGAGHTAALSSWINLPSGTTTAGNYICAQSNGIWAADITMGACDLIFGMRAIADLVDTTGWGALAPFSLSTGNKAITAIFQKASDPAIGYVARTISTSTVASGTVPFMCAGGGTGVRYVHIYESTS